MTAVDITVTPDEQAVWEALDPDVVGALDLLAGQPDWRVDVHLPHAILHARPRKAPR